MALTHEGVGSTPTEPTTLCGRSINGDAVGCNPTGPNGPR